MVNATVSILEPPGVIVIPEITERVVWGVVKVQGMGFFASAFVAAPVQLLIVGQIGRRVCKTKQFLERHCVLYGMAPISFAA
jgi:hypothetical protein